MSAVSDLFVDDPVISDHYAVHCNSSVDKPKPPKQMKYFHKLRSIDLEAFRHDIINSSLSISCIRFNGTL